MKCLLLVVIAIFATAVKCQSFTEVVYTEKGPIRGAIFETVYNKIQFSEFLGIPYAEPPLGKLRYEPPVEIGPWTEVLNATQDIEGCPQLQFNSFHGNEDCLYLNVYTPALEFDEFFSLKPVVVWIHGGGFITGTGAKSVYGPDRLLEKDLVVVAMNYRLGPCGFLSLDIPGATGNQGLKDQNLALQWVQKNIAKFGGDPDRVTIMGESAGAVSMTYHMISPKSRGLFHQVIVQSGSALAPWGYKSPTASKWTAYELAKRINITAKTDSDLLAALKEVDIKTLVTEATIMTNVELPIPLRIAFVPTSETGDDAFIDDCPLSYFESGNFSHVPTLLGYTAEETILYTIGLDNVRYELQQKLLSLTKVLDLTGHNNLVINVVNSILNDTVWEIIKASSVYDFSGPVDLTQRFLTKNNGDEPTYFYRLSYNTNHNYHKVANPHISGTSHADDLPLIFYFVGDSTDPSDPYNIYCDRVVTLWANFIKYGNPTPFAFNLDGTHWEPSGEEGFQLDMGNEQFLMNDRFIVSRDALVEQIYYDGLPVTSQCKNYPFSSPSIYYVKTATTLSRRAYTLRAKMKYSLFVVIAIFATAVKCQNVTQVVQTNKGPVQGATLKTVFNKKEYSAFIGIPYAIPPVDDLRFKPPVEAEPWFDVMNVTEDKSVCPQMANGTVIGSEDCLYLNVYTPLTDFNKIETLKAVLVWIHGGGFISGTSAKSLYGPDSFIEEDIILVDMNYRLNILGFLSMIMPDAMGNQGLKDQNLALRWVQENIAKFGGDPNRVTIMGESAGAASASYHIISPKSRNLFQKVIVHSGSSLAPWGYKSPTASKWTAYELAKRMNITAKSDSDLLACLKKADIKDLIPAATEMTNDNLPVPMRIAFVPTSETGNDAFIDDCPISYFQSGNYNHVPMMFGYTAEEAILYSIGLDTERYELQQKLLGLTKVVDLTGHNNLIVNVANNLLNDTVWEIIKSSSVYVFSGPMDLMQRFVAKSNGDLPVYFFRVSYRTEYSYHERVNPHINGTSHADDLVLFFPLPGNPTDPNHPFVIYSKKVVAMWANFIKYGNPTPDDSDGAHWEPSGEQGLQMDIGNDGFIMKDRFIVSRDAVVMKTYYTGLPVTSECKNYPFGAPSIY
ncbi:uncharacterized protein LOC143342778 [Colletes latitarsis]|uniref:uncharacterized protein LOC143342778 n=1 Tax=Colletes latitarsis TaxID=2605962 RepID=UPI0040367050